MTSLVQALPFHAMKSSLQRSIVKDGDPAARYIVNTQTNFHGLL